MTVKQLIDELQQYDNNLDVLFVDLLNGGVSKAVYSSPGRNVGNHTHCVYLLQDVVKRNALPLANLSMDFEDGGTE